MWKGAKHLLISDWHTRTYRRRLGYIIDYQISYIPTVCICIYVAKYVQYSIIQV